MSEHKAPDLQSLTPEEAFNPELRQQKAEWEAYVDSRHYEDDDGRLRAPNGQFASVVSFDKSRKAHFDNATDAYEDLSISALADRLAWTDIHGDTTVSGDITDVLMDKMIAFADKNDMDSDAQTNLYNRVLTLVDKKKESYLSEPENLDLTKTERDALNQQKNEKSVSQDSPEHEDDHSHDHDHQDDGESEGSGETESSDEDDAESKSEAQKELEELLLRQLPEQIDELKASTQEIADLGAADQQAESGDASQEQATRKRGSRLKRLFSRMRNWKLLGQAGQDSSEQSNNQTPIKPKRRIVPVANSENEAATTGSEEQPSTENDDSDQEADDSSKSEEAKRIVDESIRAHEAKLRASIEDLQSEEGETAETDDSSAQDAETSSANPESSKSITEQLQEEYPDNPNAGSFKNVARRITDEAAGIEPRPPLTESEETAKRIARQTIEDQSKRPKKESVSVEAEQEEPQKQQESKSPADKDVDALADKEKESPQEEPSEAREAAKRIVAEVELEQAARKAGMDVTPWSELSETQKAARRIVAETIADKEAQAAEAESDIDDDEDDEVELPLDWSGGTTTDSTTR